MSYKVKTIDSFEREAKRLIKKYASLKNELAKFIQDIGEQPLQGTPIGKGCYKLRLSISSKGKGKRGGARIITYIVFDFETIYLLSIYDKSEKENISDSELNELLSAIEL